MYLTYVILPSFLSSILVEAEKMCEDKSDDLTGTDIIRQNETDTHILYGCGGVININCIGSCIRFHHVRYSCKEGPTRDQDKNIVMDMCKGKSVCLIKPSRDVFGDSSCPGKSDGDMKLYITYSCKGIPNNLSRVRNPLSKCRRRPRSTNDVKSKTGAVTTTAVGSVNDDDKAEVCKDLRDYTRQNGVVRGVGLKRKEEIFGCGGEIDIDCKGACIRFFHVRYSCKDGAQNFAHEKTVKDLCKGKSRCKIVASRNAFDDNYSCPGKHESQMKLFLTFSCKGTNATATIHKPDTCSGGPVSIK